METSVLCGTSPLSQADYSRGATYEYETGMRYCSLDVPPNTIGWT